MRLAALATLGKLDVAALAKYEEALAKAAEEEENSVVQHAAAELLTPQKSRACRDGRKGTSDTGVNSSGRRHNQRPARVLLAPSHFIFDAPV